MSERNEDIAEDSPGPYDQEFEYHEPDDDSLESDHDLGVQ